MRLSTIEQLVAGGVLLGLVALEGAFPGTLETVAEVAAKAVAVYCILSLAFWFFGDDKP